MKIYELKVCDFEDIKDDPESTDYGAQLVKTYQDAWEILHDDLVSCYDGRADEIPLMKMKPFQGVGVQHSTIERYWEFNDDGILYTIYEHDLKGFME